ncbi:MAG: DMT family transporter [Actinomycetota bacterium]|nr:DMT family transporter [Actinomycetota bacterium]
MGIVSPITAVMSGAIPVVVGVFGGEQPTAWAYLGMAFAVVAVILVSRESHHHGKTPPIAIVLAIASGVAIGLYLTALGSAPKDSGVWVATLGRWVSSVIMIAVVIFVVRSFTRTGFPWLLAVGAGVLDAVANGVFQLASQRGLLSVVAVLASLYPAATVPGALANPPPIIFPEPSRMMNVTLLNQSSLERFAKAPTITRLYSTSSTTSPPAF